MSKATEMSDQERLEIGRAMAVAAFKAFGQHLEDEESSDIARRVVRGLAAAQAVEDGVKGKFGAPPAHAVTATAFWAWCNGEDVSGLSEFHTIAGEQLVGFAQGLAAAAAMESAHTLLADSGEYWCAGDGAKRLLKNMP
jgi:hypothetical protein